MHEYRVIFTGDAKEYFGIWIVNILLSVVTLGIYSAWAKVRNKKYFYGNIHISNASFDYHATGKQIFIGRLVVFGMIILLSVTQFIHPFLYIACLLLLLCFIPWLITRGLRFNARMTSYRNVRFDFSGRAGGAFLVYFFYPILTTLTLYTTWPFAARAKTRYQINNHLYGDRAFRFSAAIGEFYKPFLIVIAIVIVPTLVFASLSTYFIFGVIEGSRGAINTGLILAFYALIFLFWLPAAIIYSALIRNVLYGGAVLDGKHQFQSTVKPMRLLGIVVTNLLVSIFTFGLMIPWSKIRLAKYMASTTTVFVNGPIGAYSSSVADSSGLVASEYIDLEGMDVGVGI